MMEFGSIVKYVWTTARQLSGFDRHVEIGALLTASALSAVSSGMDLEESVDYFRRAWQTALDAKKTKVN